MTDDLDTSTADTVNRLSGIRPFANGSRYEQIPLATIEIDGLPIRYVRRRFVPQPSRFALLHEYTVEQGDRVDNIAAGQLGDPELFWRLADANRAVHPNELAADIGRRLRITLPADVPSMTDVT
jgi:hypothetical protein